MPENSDIKIARLEEKLDYLTKAVEKMSLSLENLSHTFVPRSEFDMVKIAVMGVANEGGVLKKVSELEELNLLEVRKKTNDLWDLRWKLIAIAFAGGLIGEMLIKFLYSKLNL